MKKLIIIISSIVLVSCGGSSEDKSKAENGEYKLTPSTIKESSLAGAAKRQWTLSAENLPTGVISSDVYHGIIFMNGSNKMTVMYDETNFNQNVEYFVSKDTLIMSFLGEMPVKLKYIVQELTDSTLVLNYPDNKANGVKYFKKDY